MITKSKFKADAEAAFRRANPNAQIEIEWLTAKLVTYPTGIKEWYGRFYAHAAGHKPRVMTASGDNTYVMVR